MPVTRRAVALYIFDGIVVAFFLPSRHKVVAVLLYHAVKFGNLIGTVLHIGIHCDDHIAIASLETDLQRSRFTIVPTERNTTHLLVLFLQVADDFPRIVGTAVINKQNFKRKRMLVHHAHNPFAQFGQGFLLVIQRNYNRNIHNY